MSCSLVVGGSGRKAVYCKVYQEALMQKLVSSSWLGNFLHFSRLEKCVSIACVEHSSVDRLDEMSFLFQARLGCDLAM